MQYFGISNYKDYLSFEKIWNPSEESDQSLFLVRVPSDLKTLTFRTYLDLMNCRIEWMLREALTTQGSSKETLQSQMVQTLQALNPTQEAPMLWEEDGEIKPMWVWAMDWGTSLLEFNETWMEWFQMTNPTVTFPVNLSQQTGTQPSLTERHDAVSLDQFLMQLRAKFALIQ
jgi:hypothetical protein